MAKRGEGKVWIVRERGKRPLTRNQTADCRAVSPGRKKRGRGGRKAIDPHKREEGGKSFSLC